MLQFLIYLSSSINVAIDFGSFFVKSSTTLFTEAPIIGINSNGKRYTPSFLAFRSKPQFNVSIPAPLAEDETDYLTPEIGEKGMHILDSRPWMGSGYFTTFAGITEEEREEISDSLFINTTAARVKLIDLIPLYLKSYISMVAEKRIAALSKIPSSQSSTFSTYSSSSSSQSLSAPAENKDDDKKKTAKEESSFFQVKEVALVLPPSFTTIQRSIFEESLNLCRINDITLIDDVDAVSFTYALERSFKFSKKPRKVLFIDIGATSIEGYVVQFELISKNPVVTRLSYAIDHKNGGSYVTSLLVSHIKEKLKIEGKTSGAENRRLFSAAEKVKIELSKANSSVVIIQNINGRDYDFTLSREDLENQFVAASLAQAVVNVAKEATTKNNLVFDDIELIGGSSRIPIIERALKRVFNVDTIYRSLNADEAIAIGASYYLQQKLNITKFKRVKIVDKAPVYTIDMLTEDETISVCKKNEFCVDEINISGNIGTVNLMYHDDEIREVLESNSDCYDLESINNGTLVFKFSHRPTKINSLLRCKGTKCKNALFERLNPTPFNKDIVMLFIDSNVRNEKIEKAKREVQNYANKLLKEVANNATVRFFTNHSQRIEIIRCIEKERSWNSAQNTAIKLSDLKNIAEHIRKMKKCVSPVYKRIDENTTFLDVFQDLYMTLQMARQLLFDIEVYQPNIEKEKVFVLKQKFLAIDKWLNVSIEMNKAIRPYEFRPIRPKEFREKAIELSTELKKVQNELKKFDDANQEQNKKENGSTKPEYVEEREKLIRKMKKMKDREVEFEFGSKKQKKNLDL